MSLMKLSFKSIFVPQLFILASDVFAVDVHGYLRGRKGTPVSRYLVTTKVGQNADDAEEGALPRIWS